MPYKRQTMKPISEETTTRNARKLIELQHQYGGVVSFNWEDGNPRAYVVWFPPTDYLSAGKISKVQELASPVIAVDYGGNLKVI